MIGSNPPLCTPCQTARTGWLDYRLPPSFGFAHGSGAPYDVSAAGIRDRRRAQFEEWRSLVRFQMDLIARQCRAGQHTHAVPAPRLIQLDLFEALEVAA